MRNVFWVVMASVSFFVAPALAMAAEKGTDKAPAASQFYPLLGKWKGKAEIQEQGKPVVKLSMTVHCSKGSAGHAVRCDTVAKNEQLTIAESDLFGFDPITNTGHWYSISNIGEAHDHITQWPDANTMQARYAWTQEGKKFEEHVTFAFKGKHLSFKSTTSVEGNQVAVFSGELTR